MNYRAENVRYLRPYWIRAGVVGLIVAVVVAWGIAQALRSRQPAMLAGGLIGASIGVMMRGLRTRRARRAWDCPNADAAARHVFGPLLASGASIAQPVAIAGTAQIQLIYGNRERAFELLARQDWSRVPPVLRSEAELAYALADITNGDYAAAHRRAQEVVALADVPRLAPGARRAHDNVSTFLAITSVLADNTPASRALLQRPRAKSRLLRGLAAWALAQCGDAPTRWQTLLPHAHGLGVARPERTRGASTVAVDNPYAAPVAEAAFEPVAKGGAWKVRMTLIVLTWIAIAALYFFIM